MASFPAAYELASMPLDPSSDAVSSNAGLISGIGRSDVGLLPDVGSPHYRESTAVNAFSTLQGVSGISLTSTPIASATAFAMAGATPMIGGSASPFAPV